MCAAPAPITLSTLTVSILFLSPIPQFKTKSGHLSVRVRVNDKFGKVLPKVQKALEGKGLLPPGATCWLRLDGDKIEADDTPASLDLEDDFCIDVIAK
jgi:hypothetical protein